MGSCDMGVMWGHVTWGSCDMGVMWGHVTWVM